MGNNNTKRNIAHPSIKIETGRPQLLALQKKEPERFRNYEIPNKRIHPLDKSRYMNDLETLEYDLVANRKKSEFHNPRDIGTNPY